MWSENIVFHFKTQRNDAKNLFWSKMKLKLKRNEKFYANLTKRSKKWVRFLLKYSKRKRTDPFSLHSASKQKFLFRKVANPGCFYETTIVPTHSENIYWNLLIIFLFCHTIQTIFFCIHHAWDAVNIRQVEFFFSELEPPLSGLLKRFTEGLLELGSNIIEAN